ncbi:mucin-2-like isoform X2 [Mytilus trossulus]|uniref:mucin-2-like isoform X2 n=1 Tax=Mytilus trossulus TaxID=6551 RepID=UPI0030051F99
MIVIPVLLLVSFSTKTSGQGEGLVQGEGQVQGKSWDTLTNDINPVTGWAEPQPTPTADPNTSTPGSTVSSQSQTEPTQRRKQHNMRESGFSASEKQPSLSLGKMDTGTFHYKETETNTDKATNSKIEQSANEIPAVPVPYTPVNMDVLDSNPKVLNAPVVIPETQIIELNHNSPHAIKDNQSRLSKQTGLSTGIKIPMSHFRRASSGSRVDSNINTDNNYIIMEPVPRENIVAAQDNTYSLKFLGDKEQKTTDEKVTSKSELVDVRPEYLVDVKRINNEVPPIPLTTTESVQTPTIQTNPQVVGIPIDGTIKTEVGIPATSNTEQSDKSFISQAVDSKAFEPLKGTALEEPVTEMLFATNIAKHSGTLTDSSIVDSNKPSRSDNEQNIPKDVPAFTNELATTEMQTNPIEGNNVENKVLTELIATGSETERTTTGTVSKNNEITKATGSVNSGTSEMNNQTYIDFPIEGPIKDTQLANDVNESSKTPETYIAAPFGTNKEPVVKDLIDQSKTFETISAPRSSGTVLEESNKDTTLDKGVIDQSITSEKISVPEISGPVVQEPNKDTTIVSDVIEQTISEQQLTDKAVGGAPIAPGGLSIPMPLEDLPANAVQSITREGAIEENPSLNDHIPVNEGASLNENVPTAIPHSNVVTNTEAVFDTNAATNTEAVLDNKAATNTEEDLDSKTSPNTEVVLDKNAGSNTETVLDSKTSPNTEVVLDKKAATNTETVLDSKTSPNTEVVLDKNAGTNTETVLDSKTSPNTEVVLDKNAGTNTETVLDSKTSPNTEVVLNNNAATNIEVLDSKTSPNTETVLDSNTASNTGSILDSTAAVNNEAVLDSKTAVNNEAVLDRKTAVNTETILDNTAAANNEAVLNNTAAENNKAVLDGKTAVNNEAVLDSYTATDTGAVLDSMSTANTGAVLDSMTAPKTELGLESKTIPNTEAVVDNTAVTNTEALLDSNAATNAEAVFDSMALTHTGEVLVGKTATTDAGLDSKATTNTESVVDGNTATKTEAVLVINPVTNTETILDSNVAEKTEAVVDSKTATNADAVFDSNAATNNETVLDSIVATKPEAVVDSKAATNADAVFDSNAATNTETVLDSIVATKPEAVVDSKAATNADAVFDSNAATNTETVLDSIVATKPEAVVDSKSISIDQAQTLDATVPEGTITKSQNVEAIVIPATLYEDNLLKSEQVAASGVIHTNSLDKSDTSSVSNLGQSLESKTVDSQQSDLLGGTKENLQNTLAVSQVTEEAFTDKSSQPKSHQTKSVQTSDQLVGKEGVVVYMPSQSETATETGLDQPDTSVLIKEVPVVQYKATDTVSETSTLTDGIIPVTAEKDISEKSFTQTTNLESTIPMETEGQQTMSEQSTSFKIGDEQLLSNNKPLVEGSPSIDHTVISKDVDGVVIKELSPETVNVDLVFSATPDKVDIIPAADETTTVKKIDETPQYEIKGITNTEKYDLPLETSKHTDATKPMITTTLSPSIASESLTLDEQNIKTESTNITDTILPEIKTTVSPFIGSESPSVPIIDEQNINTESTKIADTTVPVIKITVSPFIGSESPSVPVIDEQNINTESEKIADTTVPDIKTTVSPLIGSESPSVPVIDEQNINTESAKIVDTTVPDINTTVSPFIGSESPSVPIIDEQNINTESAKIADTTVSDIKTTVSPFIGSESPSVPIIDEQNTNTESAKIADTTVPDINTTVSPFIGSESQSVPVIDEQNINTESAKIAPASRLVEQKQEVVDSTATEPIQINTVLQTEGTEKASIEPVYTTIENPDLLVKNNMQGKATEQQMTIKDPEVVVTEIKQTEKQTLEPRDKPTIEETQKTALPETYVTDTGPEKPQLKRRLETTDVRVTGLKPEKTSRVATRTMETTNELSRDLYDRSMQIHQRQQQMSNKFDMSRGAENTQQDRKHNLVGEYEPEFSSPALETLCGNSMFIDGIGYAEYPGYCDKLVQCFHSDGKVVAVQRECPYGYFWHQDQVLCRPPAEVPCYDDPCLDIDMVQYNRTGGCRSYYRCDYGISVPMCCEKGYRYNNYGCVPDPTCRDNCLTPYDIENRMRFQACKFLPDEYNPHGYLTLEYNGLRIRACPEGTVFSARQCGCRRGSGPMRSGRRRMRECQPDFYMNFNYGFKELSGSNMAFDVHNVVINDGAAQFNGNGRITLWGFMNKELGTKLAIRLRFKPDPKATEKGNLISNCGMTGTATVAIGLENHKVKLVAKSNSFSRRTFITSHFDPYSWNDLTYVYDGNSFVASIDGYRSRKPLGGMLETRSNAIVIGGCPKPGSGYTGLIDSIEVFSGCIPRHIYKPRKQR